MYTYQPCPECRKVNRISLESLIQAKAKKQPQCGHCQSAILMTGIIGEVNASGLMALVEKSPMPVVAAFWSPQAKGSEQFASAYFQVAQYFARDATFVRVNIQEHRLAPEAYGITHLPTTLAFSSGFERARIARPLLFEELGGWLQTVLLANPKDAQS